MTDSELLQAVRQFIEEVQGYNIIKRATMKRANLILAEIAKRQVPDTPKEQSTR